MTTDYAAGVITALVFLALIYFWPVPAAHRRALFLLWLVRTGVTPRIMLVFVPGYKIDAPLRLWARGDIPPPRWSGRSGAMGKIRTIAILGMTSLLVAGAAIHNVGTAVTEEDVYYGSQILERAGYDPGPGAFGDLSRFENQIAAILAVQDAVLKATPLGIGLPHGRPREPKDVLIEGQGLCFDRSRAIEKILTGLGFETRHLAIYTTRDYGRLRALMTPGISSHALTEVKTGKGWIAVDSNARWIGLDAAGRVYSVEDIQGRNPFAITWAPEVREPISWPLFNEPFTYVIGLYSRHGGFFPPYTPVPDVNYVQPLQNIY